MIPQPAMAKAQLIERVRALLTEEPSTREVSMFGGRSFMVNDKLVACAQKDGDLLVRVAADQHDELTARPGAAQAEMGAGRNMGRGWISVAAASIVSDEALSSWLDVALDHNHATGARTAQSLQPASGLPGVRWTHGTQRV